MAEQKIDGLPWNQVMALKRQFFEEIIDYHPWHAQWKHIHSRPQVARFLVQCWGRQSGKTYALARENLWQCFYQPEGEIWHVVPEYDLAQPVWQDLVRITDQKFLPGMFDWCRTAIDRRAMTMEFSNGVRFAVKSTKIPGSLQGRALRHLSFDECATERDRNIWEQYLRPTIAVNKSRAIFISTPKGLDWFWELYCKGEGKNRRQNPEYYSARVPSKASPYMPREEYLQAKHTLPERIFRQEWLAEFVSAEGGVFSAVDSCYGGSFEQPQEGRHYVVGLDLAKHVDFSVCCVMDRDTKHVVFFRRWQKQNWDLQAKLFAEIAVKYNMAHVILDQTGLGDVFLDNFRKAYWRAGNGRQAKVEGFNLSAGAKEDLINNLVLGIEQQMLTFPKCSSTQALYDELISYEYQRTPSGRLAMRAPVGRNDDCVIALALAYWGATKATGYVRVLNAGQMR